MDVEDHKKALIALTQALEDKRTRERIRDSLAEFVKWAWPIIEPGRELQWNWSIDLICRFLEDFAKRRFRRGIINIPPRGMKSILVSVMFPVWVWIQDPKDIKERHGNVRWRKRVGPSHQFLCLANAEDLALRDASQMRNILEHEKFTRLFGRHVWIPAGQNEKKYYRNNVNGHRNSRPIQGTLTGKGGDTTLIDDPHDAEKAQSDAERQNTLDAYFGRVTSRLNDQRLGGILIIMQRVHGADLVGAVIKKDGHWSPFNLNGWVQLVLPMEYEVDDPKKEGIDGIVNPAGLLGYKDPRTEPGELLWESRFPVESVRQLESDLRATSGVYGASCQLQQRPSPSEGGILKKSWWRRWPDDRPFPVCEHVFLSWDTAYSEQDFKAAAFSARTAWGVFWDEQSQRHCIILLHAWAERVGYPDLRAKAQEDSESFAPDAHLIEKKASGISLVQDLRRAGKGRKRVRLRTYQPDRDKIARAHAASSALSSGMVYAPNRKWADKVIDACAEFPNGAPPSADYTDTFTQAVLYLTHGWWVRHPDDDDDEIDNTVGSQWVDEEDETEVTVNRGYYG